MAANQFSTLLLEGLDHYRKGRMMEAVKAWEAAYLLEPTNLRAREFLRSALERIHAHMGSTAPGTPEAAAAPKTQSHPWLPDPVPAAGSTPPPENLRPQTRASFLEAPAESPSGPSAPPRSPWDEGPSLAIPTKEVKEPVGEISGAWSIHKPQETGKIQPGAEDETEVWLGGARELVALNDFSGALELLRKVIAADPENAEAQRLHHESEHNLTLMFESKIGGMDQKPHIAISPDEVIWLNLDPRAGFVLAQIDGMVTFEDLYAVCGLSRLDTARILSQLLEEGVIKVQGRPAAVAKRARRA